MLHPFSIHNLSCQLVVRGGSKARPVALRNISYTVKADCRSSWAVMLDRYR